MSEADFNKAAEEVKTLKTKPGQDDMLKLYGLFKQASDGDVQSARPGAFDFVGKAKWDAYKKNEGMSQEDARQQYIELVESLKAKDG